MNRKIVFLDIDGTLVDSLGLPSEASINAIKQARNNGHKVLLCTGRNMPIINQEILDVGFDGVIASAGAYIIVDHKVIYDQLMEEELVQECLDVFHNNDIYCRIESKDGIYLDEEMEELISQSSEQGGNSELVRMQKELEQGLDFKHYDQYPKTGAYKICFTTTDLTKLEVPKRILGDRFHFVVHAFGGFNSIYNGEIIRKGIDKGDAVEMVCDYYNASKEDGIAFGDSMNDMSMMKSVGVAVAMGNACDEIKKAADLICKSVTEEGIADGFMTLNLI